MREQPEMPLSVELLVVPDCPSCEPTQRKLRAVLDEFGFSRTVVQTTVIDSEDEAVARGFTGSPSLRINGRDPTPGPGPVGVSCRLYRTADGLPDVRAALEAASES